MRSQLELWRDIMVDGSKTPPRRQPRDTMTVKGQMYGILPAITRWVEGGRTSLVGVDTEDILAALPDDPSPDRDEPIPRYSAHALWHTFAAISLSEAGADLLAVSRAMGHARPSITLDRYGHLAPAGLAPLMARIDDVVAPLRKAA